MNCFELILFTYGDARNPSTWSNVPFCFSQALLSKKCIIHYVDISNKVHLIEKIYNLIIYKPLSVFFKGHLYSFQRSNIFYFFTNYKIRRSVKCYSSADWCFFLNFDFYNKFSNVPSLLFGDWTFRILIEDRLRRDPFFFEKWYIRKQDKAINNANIVISMFPDCAKSIQGTYPNITVRYLNQNVINTLYKGNIDINSLINNKINSNSILFVGDSKYLNGAKLLKDAVNNIRRKGIDIELNVIGLSCDELGVSTLEMEFIHCFGYLDKASDDDRDLYYKLIFQAKVFCNPSPIWGGYSSTVEAMYYYTPIVNSGFKDFVSEFGERINFGVYDNELCLDSVSNAIVSIIYNPDYPTIARNAHKAVANYTWSNYVEKILGLCQNPNGIVNTI